MSMQVPIRRPRNLRRKAGESALESQGWVPEAGVCTEDQETMLKVKAEARAPPKSAAATPGDGKTESQLRRAAKLLQRKAAGTKLSSSEALPRGISTNSFHPVLLLYHSGKSPLIGSSTPRATGAVYSAGGSPFKLMVNHHTCSMRERPGDAHFYGQNRNQNILELIVC